MGNDESGGVKPLGSWAPRVALWVLVFLLLAGAILVMPGARAADPNYTLLGSVELPGGGIPVPPGVTVDLISSASHQVFTTKTTTSGQYAFTTANTGGALAPGWWGLSVPPQANLTLTGCKPCGIFPLSNQPIYTLQNVTSLTSPGHQVRITGVQPLQYNTTVSGTVMFGGSPAPGASVQLLAPTFNGFVVTNNTTTSSGAYQLKVPWSSQLPYGAWVLQTTVPGFPNHYNLTQLVVNSAGAKVVNPIVGNFLAYGFANLASNPNAHISNAGNLTIFDTNNFYIYSQPMPPGGFYSTGTYPANFKGPGAESFEVVVAPIDYTTVSYPLTVGPGNPTNARDVLVSPTVPPASYQTTLNLSTLNPSTGTGKLLVTTNATLSNDSTLTDFPNATVGQLWAQLALDFQHNSLTFLSSNLPQVLALLNTSGPFFPAVSANTMVNGTAFTQPANYQFTNSTTCSGSCGLTSGASLSMGWSQLFNLAGSVPKNSKSYGISFTFRHPNNEQMINYTVVLPAGYVLNAGTAPPAQSQLVPAGPGGTWTKFTLVAQPSPNPFGTAQFTVVKSGNVTANVNVSVPTFSFSSHNVLNQTHGGYTVIVGVGENATFSGLNSTYPTGTNGTNYLWNFGDGSSTVSTSQPTTSHSYATFGKFSGTLKVTASGGLTNSVGFTVYAATGPATASPISSNATAAQTFNTSGGTKYLIINWGTSLHFNSSQTSAILYPGASLPGIISVSSWSIVAHSFKAVANFSLGGSSGVRPASNFSWTFLGNGYYLTSGIVNGNAVPMPLPGWQYNVTLTVWDAAGHSAAATLVVLVKDLQKPIASVAALDANGKSIGQSGIVEGFNHTAEVQLSAQNSSDPNNGSLVAYNWKVTNAGNTSVNISLQQNPTASGYQRPVYWLAPQLKPYSVNLTVTDRAGNTAFTVLSVTVSANTTTRPIMAANNLTAANTFTAGTSYTIFVNVTAGGGTKSVANEVMVAFYLLPPSGVGNPIFLASSPGSVRFYNYTAPGVPNVNPFATGMVSSMVYNSTVRALITWTPARTGNWVLYANASASNEFSGNYINGPNTVHQPITINQNPLVQLEEYGAIAAVAVIVIVALIFFYRRRVAKPASKSTSGRSGLERGSSKRDEKDEEDEES